MTGVRTGSHLEAGGRMQVVGKQPEEACPVSSESQREGVLEAKQKGATCGVQLPPSSNRT